jgi:hypothetical protein
MIQTTLTDKKKQLQKESNLNLKHKQVGISDLLAAKLIF